MLSKRKQILLAKAAKVQFPENDFYVIQARTPKGRIYYLEVNPFVNKREKIVFTTKK